MCWYRGEQTTQEWGLGSPFFSDEIKVINTKDGWWLLSFPNCILSVWVSLAGPTENHKCLQELEPDNSLWCRVRDDWRWNMKDAMCKMMQCVRCRSLEGGYPSSVEVIEDNEDFVCFLGFYSLFSVPLDLQNNVGIKVWEIFEIEVLKDFFWNLCLRDLQHGL